MNDSRPNGLDDNQPVTASLSLSVKHAALETPAANSPEKQPIPRHVAIIMDGNGRWATRQGLSRSEGHVRGADSVQRAVEFCVKKGIRILTLYCFSNENWKRPEPELTSLMRLLETFMRSWRDKLVEKNIRLRVLGRREGIPESALREMDDTIAATADKTSLTLQLAINYGARQEILDACRAIVKKSLEGSLAVEQITEQTISENLYTAGVPDPDLLIRTAGELRISNYLLWQISYSEIWVTETLWPDFTEETFQAALDSYATRVRRFGAVKE